MNRRQFLGLLSAGSLPLAGCTGSDEQQVRTVTVTVTKDPTTTPETATGDPTDAAKTTEITDESATTESTTAPEDVAAEHIQSAKTLLEEAITTYAHFGGEQNASILNVTASSETFDSQKIDSKVVEARSALSKADSNAVSEQQETISKLRELTNFLPQIGLAQAKLTEGYQYAKAAEDALHEAQFEDVWSDGKQAKNAGAGARAYLDAATAESSAESCSVVGALSESEYNKKVQQIEQEASAIRTIGEQLRKLRNGVREYNRAIEQYSEGDYKYAKEYFASANNEFTGITDGIENQDHRSPVRGLYSDVDCFGRALAGTTKHLEKASDSGLERDEKAQEEEDEKATEAFRSCKVVRDVMGEIY